MAHDFAYRVFRVPADMSKEEHRAALQATIRALPNGSLRQFSDCWEVEHPDTPQETARILSVMRCFGLAELVSVCIIHPSNASTAE